MGCCALSICYPSAHWTADGRYQEQTEILEYTVTHKKESIRFPSENGSVYGGTENENCEITYGPGTYTVTMETSPSLPASVEDPREQGSSARIYRVRTLRKRRQARYTS